MIEMLKKKLSTQVWYLSANITLIKAFFLMLSCYLFLTLLYFLGGNEFVYNRIVHPLVFSIRNHSEKVPQLDPRIKIFAVDHRTMADLGVAAIPADEWISLFRALALAHPQAIFIDKSLPIPLSRDPAVRKKLVNQVTKTRPIAAGAFFVPNLITGFDEIIEIDLDFDLNANSLSWLQWTPGHFYGPEPQIRKAFSQIGHTNYEGFGYIKPLIKASVHRIMPFWGLNLLGKLSTKSNTLYINSNPIPVNSNGEILVNLAPAENYWKHTYSLVTLLRKARQQLPLDEISSSDIVIILADMVQGATAYRETPAGVMPGGFILTEVVNSVLRNTWLKPVGGENLLILLFCLLGMVLALPFRAVPFVSSLVALVLLMIGIGIGGFYYYGLLLPWVFPTMGFFSSAVLVFSERLRIFEMRSRQLRFSLEGMIGPEKLKTLLSKDFKTWLEPKSQVLSVMFIDIVGFSMTAEEEKPLIVFRQLRGILSDISEIVHACGGIVDKSLGDGLLCFFGYKYEDSSEANDQQHAKQALDCATRIQKAAVERNLDSALTTPFFPLRIGINTGDVYVGDLGGTRRVDITLIGHSVNYARRLESACEIYRVMIGAATWDMLGAKSNADGFIKKRIPIKHQEELGEAYEYNPFYNEKKALDEAVIRYRKASNLSRGEERFPVEPSLGYAFQSNLGSAEIIDFSRSGISIQMDNYFVKGTELKFAFTSANGALQKACESKGLFEVSGVVRWGHPNNGGFRHGVFLNKLSSQEKDNLMQCFRAEQTISKT